MSAATAKTHEPSMEEILASIRRIIADDQDSSRPDELDAERAPQPDVTGTVTVASGPDASPEEFGSADAPEAMPEADASSMVSADAPVAVDDLEADIPDLTFAEVVPSPAEEPQVSEPAPPQPSNSVTRAAALDREPARSARDEPLISSQTTANVENAFHMLSRTVLSQNTRTLEDLVQDMLKPMLKAWLDDNLPPLVERLVRAEIERVARGRG